VIDVDDVLREELDRLAPMELRPDWDDVVARSGLKRERAQRRWVAAVVVAATAITLGVATPLGSAIVNGLGDFSAWLTGQPGSPVSKQEQREFEESNARSWLRFPEGTQLRRLITHRAGPTTIELLGFPLGFEHALSAAGGNRCRTRRRYELCAARRTETGRRTGTRGDRRSRHRQGK
jgi:hypothetical protein